MDKTLSELYDLLDSTWNERLLAVANMAVNTIKNLQDENENLQHEINRLKSDAKYFADERNYGSILLENADLIKFQETTKRVVGDFLFHLILEEMENE